MLRDLGQDVFELLPRGPEVGGVVERPDATFGAARLRRDRSRGPIPDVPHEGLERGSPIRNVLVQHLVVHLEISAAEDDLLAERARS